MYDFLNVEKSQNKCELMVDTKLFNKDIVLKTAFIFLDRAYFFFKLDKDDNIIVQITVKDNDNLDKIIADFSDELLEISLRDKLERKNKKIREAIVTAAIGNSLDSNNFVSIDTDKQWEDNQNQNQIDFDKDIDEILKEIESDPELKILKEIEEETETEINTKDNDKINKK